MIRLISGGRSVISRLSGTVSTVNAPDHTSICGLRPNLSARAPMGYWQAMNTTVPIESARNTSLPAAPRNCTANGVSALKNV